MISLENGPIISWSNGLIIQLDHRPYNPVVPIALRVVTLAPMLGGNRGGKRPLLGYTTFVGVNDPCWGKRPTMG